MKTKKQRTVRATISFPGVFFVSPNCHSTFCIAVRETVAFPIRGQVTTLQKLWLKLDRNYCVLGSSFRHDLANFLPSDTLYSGTKDTTATQGPCHVFRSRHGVVRVLLHPAVSFVPALGPLHAFYAIATFSIRKEDVETTLLNEKIRERTAQKLGLEGGFE